MIRVWFNHWFSTSYRLIELMKEEKDVVVIGSNSQKNSVIQKVCDEWYGEPDVSGDEYVDYCLQFCREKKIDVFVPRREMVAVSRRKAEFLENGVKVMVDDYHIIQLLNDKAATYDLFRDCPGIHVPDYAIVNTAEEFEEAYLELRKQYDQLCVKFVKDEGGMSFRRIVEQVDRFDSIRSYSRVAVEFATYLEILKTEERFDDLMVMPYLPGDEISVDCLATSNGLLAVPRIKGNSRDERIVFDEQLLHMAELVMDKIQLDYPCNIQFKVKDNIPYLLEINTRMSGGLQMSCLGAGVNIPGIALCKMLGRETRWKLDKKDRIVSYIEIPQIIC